MYTAPGHYRKGITMSPNKPIAETLKKVLLVPTRVFLAAVAIMALGIFFVVACVTLPFAVTFLIIKVSETD